MEILLLQNQIIIMEALLDLTKDPNTKRLLNEQIVFTTARIKALS
jgi:hypothetical protein